MCIEKENTLNKNIFIWWLNNFPEKKLVLDYIAIRLMSIIFESLHELKCPLECKQDWKYRVS